MSSERPGGERETNLQSALIHLQQIEGRLPAQKQALAELIELERLGLSAVADKKGEILARATDADCILARLLELLTAGLAQAKQQHPHWN